MKEYKLGVTLTHCATCYDRNNKIYEAYYDEPELPEHDNCKCYLEWLKSLGWKSRLGNLDKIAPGKMMGGNIYKNKLGILPNKEGRVWYECDVDYQGGYRNNARLVYSNDGLIFKTDSHYTNFIAIE